MMGEIGEQGGRRKQDGALDERRQSTITYLMVMMTSGMCSTKMKNRPTAIMTRNSPSLLPSQLSPHRPSLAEPSTETFPPCLIRRLVTQVQFSNIGFCGISIVTVSEYCNQF